MRLAVLLALLIPCVASIGGKAVFVSADVSSDSHSAFRRRASDAQPIRFASFNIQVFGRKKAGDSAVLNTLARILSRYDVVVVMEIRDSSGTAIVSLLEQTNRLLAGDPFSYVISKRTGRTVSKEQYAILYRSSVAEVVSSWTVADPGDRFQREPFAASLLLNSRKNRRQRQALTVMCLHTEPEESVAELDALHDIVRPMRQEKLLIAGDLNADCGYVTRRQMADLALRRDVDFRWLIEDDADTTVKSTDCAYDRLIVSQPALSMVARPRVFRFDVEYGLSSDEAANVSDHYPVELDIVV